MPSFDPQRLPAVAQLTSAMTHRIVIVEVGCLMKKTSKKSARASRARSPKPVAKRDYMVRDPASRTRKLKVRLPAKSTAADQAEAQRHVQMLEATGQIAREPGAMPPGTTHRVETDSAGDARLVRKRFSAI